MRLENGGAMRGVIPCIVFYGWSLNELYFSFDERL